MFLSDVWCVTLAGCEVRLIKKHRFERNPPQLLCLLPACIACSSITLLGHHLKFLYIVFHCISPHPLILLLYGANVMNMSKWLLWRKRSFFRKQRKKFSFPELGKSALFYFLIHKTLVHFWDVSFRLQVILKLVHAHLDPLDSDQAVCCDCRSVIFWVVGCLWVLLCV